MICLAMLFCTDQLGVAVPLEFDTVCDGFEEEGRYRFVCSTPGVQLFVDEVQLSPGSSTTGHFWEWQPGFYAGEVSLELFDPETQAIRGLRLLVAPRQTKLERSEFLAMLDELFEQAPLLIFGTEASEHAVGVRGTDSSFQLEYARLRVYGPRFVKAMQAVLARPLTRLIHERVLRPASQLRRVDRHTVSSVKRSASALSTLMKTEPQGAGVALFDVSRSYQDMCHPANQAMLAAIRSMLRRVSRVEQALEQLVAGEEVSATRTALLPRMKRRRQVLADLHQSLKRLDRSPVFNGLQVSSITAAGLNAVSAHPAYGRAYRMAWSALRPGFSGHEGTERLWLSPTWEIYERWCFFWLARHLKEMFSCLEWKPPRTLQQVDCIEVSGRSDELVITLYLQAVFPAWDQSTTKVFRSISGKRRPDIVLTIENGDSRRFLVFDAKYRTARPKILDSMESAHLYHDCLRWNGSAPDRSVLLVPRGGGAPWLEKDEFIWKESVGVVPLAHGRDTTRMRQFLSTELQPFL